METYDRRAALALLTAAALAPAVAAEAAPAAPTMWRSPSCACCLAWAKKVEAALGRRLGIVDHPDMPALKRARGVPREIQSCHTAMIDGYVIEGHVPPEDIRKIVSTRPRGVIGLAVPGMPVGSPGMEYQDEKQAFTTFAFDGAGKYTAFAKHG